MSQVSNQIDQNETLRRFRDAAPTLIHDLFGDQAAYWCICEVDERGHPAGKGTVSPVHKAFIGFDDEPFDNAHGEWGKRIIAQDMETVKHSVVEHLAGRAPIYDTIYRILHKDGTYRWIHSRGSVIRDELGQPTAWAGIDFDVTEREQRRIMHEGECEVLQMIASGAPLPPILNRVVTLLQDVNPQATCAIFMVGEDGKHLKVGAAPGLPDAFKNSALHSPIGEACGSCGTAVHRNKLVITPDIANNDLWPEPSKEQMASLGIATAWSVPVRDKTCTPIGSFATYHRDVRTPTHAEIEQVETVAHLAAIAIDRDRTIGALRQSRTETDRAQQELRHDNLIFEQIMNTSIAAVTTLSPDGRIIYANKAAERVLGLKPDEVTGRSYNSPQWKHTALDGGPFPDEEMPFVRVLKTGEPVFDVRHAIEWPGGDRRALSINGAPVKDEAGNIVSLVFSVRDITEELRAGQAFLQSEQRFRAAFDDAPVGMALCDSEWRINTCNEQFATLLGYRMFELPGISFRTLTHPDDLPAYEALLRDMRKPSINPRTMEKRYVRKDGRAIWAQLNIRRLDDIHGNDQFIVHLVDLTPIKESERQLAEAAERFRLAARATRDAIWDVNLITNETWRNEGYLSWFGQDQNVEPGLEWWKRRIHPDDRQRVVRSFLDAVESGEAFWNEEYRMILADERVAHVMSRGYIARDHTGKALRIVGAMTDITNVIKQEAALRENDERFRALFDGADNPVTVYDRDANIVMVNDVGARHLGLPKDEIIGRPLSDFVPTHYSQTIDRITQVLDSGEPLHVEDRISLPDGDRWFISSLVPLHLSPESQPLVQVISYDITERRRTESAIRNMVTATTATGPAFFENLVLALSDALQVRYAMIARVNLDETQVAQVIAMVEGGQLTNPVEYDLAGTPCKTVADGRICFHPTGVQAKFPQDIMLQEMGADSYLGAPLVTADGRILGILVVLDTDALESSRLPTEILQVFAARAVAELERNDTLEVLKRSESHFREIAESNRRLLVEVNHRVRNNLAELLTLLKLTQQSKKSPAGVADAFRHRIDSMLQSHNLLAESGWQAMSLGRLIDRVIRVTVNRGNPVYSHGPEIDIPADFASPLAMTVAELATNAVKHGALKSHQGKLNISWRIEDRGDRQWVILDWQEIGGPPVRKKVNESLGIELVRGFIEFEMNGRCDLHFGTSGVHHMLTFPLPVSHAAE